jgi:hypothetical protein
MRDRYSTTLNGAWARSESARLVLAAGRLGKRYFEADGTAAPSRLDEPGGPLHR